MNKDFLTVQFKKTARQKYNLNLTAILSVNNKNNAPNLVQKRALCKFHNENIYCLELSTLENPRVCMQYDAFLEVDTTHNAC